MPKRKNGGDENLFSKIGRFTRAVGTAGAGKTGGRIAKRIVQNPIQEEIYTPVTSQSPGVIKQQQSDVLKKYETETHKSEEQPMQIKIGPSTPLQSRSIHHESAPIDFSALPVKSTFLDQIRDTVRNNPK